MASNTGQRLRTSCDLCQLAKVKCSRGKPSCWRCSQSGVECIYSPLRRIGRPPRRESNAAKALESATPPASLSNGSRRNKTALQCDKAKSQETSTPQPKADKPLNTQQTKTQKTQLDAAQYQQHHPEGSGDEDAEWLYSPSWLDSSVAELVSTSVMPDVVGPDLEMGESGNWDTRHTPSNANAPPMSDPMLFLDTTGGFADTNIWATQLASRLELGEDPSSTGVMHCDPSAITSSAGTASTNNDMPFECHNSDAVTNSGDLPPPLQFSSSSSSLSSTVFLNELSGNGGFGQSDLGRASLPTPSSTVAFSSFLPSYKAYMPATSTVAAISSRNQLHNTSRSKHPCPVSHSESCASGGTCYKALSELLARLGDCDESDAAGQQEAIQLDTLLCMDRELQSTARAAFNCRHCTDKSSSQNLLLLVYLFLDNMVHLFEKQQKQQDDALAARKPRPIAEQTPSWSRTSSASAKSRHGSSGPSTCRQVREHQKQDSDVSCAQCQCRCRLPWTDASLSIGNFSVDDVVKASFVHHLLLNYVENVFSMLSELEREADLVMKGVNRMMAKDKAEDIYKRTYLLRGRLRIGGRAEM